MKLRETSCFVGLIAFSFAVLVLALALRAGIGATPYETRDSAGRTLGFNDPISSEHYGIIFRNVTFSSIVEQPTDCAYAVVCGLFHGVGAWRLWSPARRGRRGTRWFFVSQAVLFSWGWFAWAMLPYYVRRVAGGTLDREDIIDVPFVWMWSGAAWAFSATIIAIFNPGEPLGLQEISGRIFARLHPTRGADQV